MAFPIFTCRDMSNDYSFFTQRRFQHTAMTTKVKATYNFKSDGTSLPPPRAESPQTCNLISDVGFMIAPALLNPFFIPR